MALFQHRVPQNPLINHHCPYWDCYFWADHAIAHFQTQQKTKLVQLVQLRMAHLVWSISPHVTEIWALWKVTTGKWRLCRAPAIKVGEGKQPIQSALIYIGKVQVHIITPKTENGWTWMVSDPHPCDLTQNPFVWGYMPNPGKHPSCNRWTFIEYSYGNTPFKLIGILL